MCNNAVRGAAPARVKCVVRHAVKVIHRRTCERTIEKFIHTYIHINILENGSHYRVSELIPCI